MGTVKIRVTTTVTVVQEIPLDPDHYESDNIDGALQEEYKRDPDDILSDFLLDVEMGNFEVSRYVSSIMEDTPVGDTHAYLKESNATT